MKCKCRKVWGTIPSAICNCNGNEIIVMGGTTLALLTSCKEGEEREMVLPLVSKTSFERQGR
jgi:hypothetical protein